MTIQVTTAGDAQRGNREAASREDLVFNLKASNEHLQVLMASNVPFDMRVRAREQLQRNLRALGSDETAIAAIPMPASHCAPPSPGKGPWLPDSTYDPNFIEHHHAGL